MVPINTYLYQGFNLDGRSYCYTCIDETMRAEGFNLFTRKDFARALVDVSAKYNRPLHLVWDVPETKEDIVTPQGFNLYDSIDRKEIPLIAEELKKVLSGK